MNRWKVVNLIIMMFLLNGCASSSVGRDEVIIPNTEFKILHSSANNQDYQINIALPQNYASETSTTYPVIYVLDGNAWFGVTTTISQMMAFGNELQEVIIVGIGYPTDELDEILKFREVDLTPTNIQNNSGGAEQFLEFLEKDLTSYIDGKYRTKDGDRTLVGKSHGGLFALYALLNNPGVFSRYIVISPTLWWDDRIIFEYEEEFAATHTNLPINLFLSVGSKEPEGKYRMVSNLKELYAKMESRQYESMKIVMIVLEDETHNSVTVGAISKGIRSVFP